MALQGVRGVFFLASLIGRAVTVLGADICPLLVRFMQDPVADESQFGPL
jgi:hypothetical protein